MYTLMIMIGVSAPLMLIGFYNLYKMNQEERKEKMEGKTT